MATKIVGAKGVSTSKTTFQGSARQWAENPQERAAKRPGQKHLAPGLEKVPLEWELGGVP